MTIRTRLALLFTLAALVVIGVAAFLFSNRLGKGLDQGLDTRLSTEMSVLKNQLAAAPGGSVSALHVTPADGFLVQVIDAHGTVIKRSRGLEGLALTDAQVAAARYRSLTTDTTATVLSSTVPAKEAVRLAATAVPNRSELLVVAIDRDLTNSAVSRATHELVMWGLGLLLLAGPAAWVLTGAALAPVERLRRHFAALDPAHLGPLIEVPHRRDEIGRLAATFNDSYLALRASVERERAFVQRERAFVARERAFVVDAGHELRTPLAVLKGELELGQRAGRSLEQLHETIAVASEETDRLIKLSEDLLLLARDEESPALRASPCDVVELAGLAAAAATQVAPGDRVHVHLDGVDELLVTADRDRIYRALLNVIANAVRAAAPEGTIEVTVTSDGRLVTVTVDDDGPGFDAEVLPVAFERFTRSTGDSAAVSMPGYGGNGLGLAIVRSAMGVHGGSVRAENRPHGGARVTLSWPRHTDCPARVRH